MSGSGPVACFSTTPTGRMMDKKIWLRPVAVWCVAARFTAVSGASAARLASAGTRTTVSGTMGFVWWWRLVNNNQRNVRCAYRNHRNPNNRNRNNGFRVVAAHSSPTGRLTRYRAPVGTLGMTGRRGGSSVRTEDRADLTEVRPGRQGPERVCVWLAHRWLSQHKHVLLNPAGAFRDLLTMQIVQDVINSYWSKPSIASGDNDDGPKGQGRSLRKAWDSRQQLRG